MFEHPPSTSVKDLLINNIVAENNYSRELVEGVIAFQGEDVLRAIKSSRQIEISGLGLLSVAPGKLKRRIERLSRLLEKDNFKYEGEKETLIKTLEYLKGKQCQEYQNS